MQTVGKNMTDGRPIRLIISLAIPLMLGNVFQQLYTVADTAIVGKVLGLKALAALGAVDWFSWMMLSFIQGLSQGFAIRMAQEYGARDWKGFKKSAGNSCVLAAVSALVLTAVGLVLIHPVLTLLQTPVDILDTSKAYLRIIFLGTPVVMGFNLLSAMLRSVGDGATPLKAMVVATVINITLDLLFVVKMNMGVEGAAVATVIAQVFSVAYCLWKLYKIGIFKLSREDFQPDGRLMLKLFGLGLPIALQNAAISIGGMIVQSVVNGFEVVFVAGFTASNKLYGVLEIAASSFGYAMTTYVGQNKGAGEYGRIRSGVRVGVLLGIVTSVIIAAIMLLFGRGLLSQFITSQDAAEAAQALQYAQEYLRLMSLYLPILYVLHIYRSSLQGLGDTFTPMLSGIAEFAMRVGAALFLTPQIGYRALFIGEILAWIGADFILLPSYWLRKRRFDSDDARNLPEPKQN